MLLEAKDIRVSFRKENQTRLFGRERQEVLHGLSIDLEEGECLGIIGESGSGKSTFGRVLCGLLAPDSGTVRLDGLDLYGRLPRADRARIQSSISIVFQDYTTSAEKLSARKPLNSLNGSASTKAFSPAIRMSFRAASSSACALPAPSL